MTIAKDIANLFYQKDQECRKELVAGILKDEVSVAESLSTRIRDAFNQSTTFGNCAFTATSLSKSEERKMGADNIVVIKIGDYYKVGVFEAKRPSVMGDKRKSKWDYPQKSIGTSHFSDQLRRQSSFKDHLVVWEMFFHDGEEGYMNEFFDDKGSTCVSHIDTKLFMMENSLLKAKRWKKKNLKELCSTHKRNIYDIIYEIIEEDSSPKYYLTPYHTIKIPIYKGDLDLSIPIPENGRENKIINSVSSRKDIRELSPNDSERAVDIMGFMNRKGIKQYTFLDIFKYKESLKED